MIPAVVHELEGRVGFCVGTGRCGTTFLAQVAGREPEVAASHERLRLGATFHMFCKWHRIAIDSEGFLRDREEAIRRDLAELQRRGLLLPQTPGQDRAIAVDQQQLIGLGAAIGERVQRGLGVEPA